MRLKTARITLTKPKMSSTFGTVCWGNPWESSGIGGGADHDAVGQRRGHGQDDVDRRSDQAHQQALVAGVTEAADVDRHRLGVAEGAEPDQQHQGRQDDRPERVDVRQGVERQSSRPLGRVVAEGQSHDPVGHLVEDDRRDQGRRRRPPCPSRSRGGSAPRKTRTITRRTAIPWYCRAPRFTDANGTPVLSAWRRSRCRFGRPAWPRGGQGRSACRTTRTARSCPQTACPGRAPPRQRVPQLEGEGLGLAPLGRDLARIGEIGVVGETTTVAEAQLSELVAQLGRAPPPRGHGNRRSRHRWTQEIKVTAPGSGRRADEPGRRPAGAGRPRPWCTPGSWRSRRGPASPGRPGCRPRGPACGWRRSGAGRGG